MGGGEKCSHDMIVWGDVGKFLHAVLGSKGHLGASGVTLCGAAMQPEIRVCKTGPPGAGRATRDCGGIAVHCGQNTVKTIATEAVVMGEVDLLTHRRRIFTSTTVGSVLTQ